MLSEAVQFIHTCYKELNKIDRIDSRISEIEKEITEKGYYEHTYEELTYGAKMAWRNSNRCIGRLFWESLTVFDKRHLTTPEEIQSALLDHISFATNNGQIRPAITVFRQETATDNRVRILNHQLIRYAGYETEDGIIGDPASVSFTKECLELGWKGNGGTFDILPIILQVDGEEPYLFELPAKSILRVPIEHPRYPWFAEFGLEWYAVPVISDMRLEIGGIHYTAAPFNGWYMGTEIGARNLADEQRYNMLPAIGEALGHDISRNSTLWKDYALVELNAAVLHSYKSKGVSIVDHHSAAQQFKLFEQREIKCGREVTGEWAWLIPPMSPATTHIFHKPYKNKIVKPNFFYQ